ncbi:MAG: BtaA family protein [Rhodospirillaceae bacterium]|nr:BtaA family protein [Rhodospirillaceae bacterium]
MTDHSSVMLIADALGGADSAAHARSDRRFTQSFARLVYTQIWEDPVVDLAALALAPQHRVVTICSAGCNALSYLTADPASVTAVDLNFAHLALADLKRAALTALSEHSDLASMFVAAAGERNRALYREQVASALMPGPRAYWDGGRRRPRADAFVSGFYRTGLLGAAVGLCQVFARLHGVRLRDALELDDACAQRRWAEKHIRPIFKGRVMSALFSLRHPLFLLGIPPRQFHLLCDGDPKRMPEVLAGRVEQLAGAAKSSENYFLWQAFTGGYAPGPSPALPPYLQPQNFDAVRARIGRLRLVHDSLTAVLARTEAQSLDRFVLLDAQDWMDRPTLAALWAQITRTARPSARVVFRTAGSAPPFLEYADTGGWSGWRRLDALSAELHGQDRSGIYGGFHVYELPA